MRLLDLGPLVVQTDSEHPVAGSKVPAILAMLIINANRRVSAEALMAAAWGDKVSAGARSTLESHIWRLRGLLEPGRGGGRAPSVLINDSNGYRLIATDDSIDSVRFQRLSLEVRDLLAAARPHRALRLADEAIALWRGEPFSLFADRDWAAPAVARMSETHQQVMERRVAALLDIGDSNLALVDVAPLISATPFREGLWGQLMLALYRSGRAEEALQAYQQARALLSTEIGVDPGPELQELHRRILAQDPGLIQSVERTREPAGPGEMHLPARLTELIGRAGDLRGVDQLIGPGRLVTVVGASGCGKTRLAIEVARVAAHRFPDGVWFVDLTAVTDADLVVDVIVSAIGIAAAALGTPLQALAAYARLRRMLLVLDNCEHVLDAVATVVEAILGDSADPVVLATSREPIGIPGEAIWSLAPLPVPRVSDTDSPLSSPAVELFVQRLSEAAPTLALDAPALRTVASICRAVDGLPLAIELAAARIRSAGLEEIAAQVSADPSGLSRIGRGPADHHQSVRSGIEWTYRLLSPEEQNLHRRLSVLPGAFTRSAAAAVSGSKQLETVDTSDVLAQLVHRSLLAPASGRRPGGPSMFSQLATIRGHAHHALVASGEREQTERRRDEWVTHLIATRPRLGRPEQAAWSRQIEDAYPAVRESLQRTLSNRRDEPHIRAAPLFIHWFYRTQLTEGERWLQLAVDSETTGNPVELAEALLALAAALATRNRPDLARPHIERALPILDAQSTPSLARIADMMVSAGSALWWAESTDLATELNNRTTELAARTGDPDLLVLAAAQRCALDLGNGNLETSVELAGKLYARATEVDNLQAIWMTAGAHMLIALMTRDPTQGIPWADRAIEAYQRLYASGAGPLVETRANFEAMAGDHRLAATLYAASRTQTRRNGTAWPRHPVTAGLLGSVQRALPREIYAEAWAEGEHLDLDDLVSALIARRSAVSKS